MKITINYPVNIEGEVFDVRMTADCDMMNTGIGSYEFMGARGYDAGFDVVDVGVIEWDEHLYTLSENNVIRKASETYACISTFSKTYKQLCAE